MIVAAHQQETPHDLGARTTLRRTAKILEFAAPTSCLADLCAAHHDLIEIDRQGLPSGGR